MEVIASLLTDLAPYMPVICFILLLLAGFNVPVSEDLVFLISAALAVTSSPVTPALVYAGCYAGASAGDIVSYSIGRFGGRRLLNMKMARKIVSADRVARMEDYFRRYGGKTLLFGRLIPFGARNVIFMTAGFSKMPFSRFLLFDIIPLTATSSILFLLGTSLGRNYRLVLPYLDRYKAVVAAAALLIAAAIIIKKIHTGRTGGSGGRSGRT